MISEIATYLPAGRLTNSELAFDLGKWTADELFAKTGIHTRCIAASTETVVDMAEMAIAILRKKRDLSKIDFLLFCTQTGDHKLPSSACLLQGRVGLPHSCGCLDINLACSGFVYGLMVANALLSNGTATEILLVNGDTYTHYIHPKDIVCRPIFGDAATVTLLRNDTRVRFAGFSFGSDGEQAMRMYLPAGGERIREFRNKLDETSAVSDPEFIRMEGPAIFNFTLQVVPKVIADCLAKAAYSFETIDYFVFHQANAFMLEGLRRKIGIPPEKFVVELADTGNLVSASIPVVLSKMQQDGRIQEGTRTLLCGFGVGLSWAACVVDW